jgi:hypothetical protein
LGAFLPEKAITATISSAIAPKTRACVFLGKTPGGFGALF